MLVRSAFITLASASLVTAASNLTWANTKNLFVFGDSYTAEGYNISAGINSPTRKCVWILSSHVIIKPIYSRMDEL